MMPYLWLLVCMCFNAVVQADLQEPPVDMLVGDDSVYVLRSSGVTKLSRNLSLLSRDSFQFLGSSSIQSDAFIMAINDDETEMLVCFAYGNCFLFDTMEYLTDSSLVSASLGFSNNNMVLTSIQTNSFYIAHQAQDKISSYRFIQLTHYSIEEPGTEYDYYDEYIPSQVRLIRSVSLRISNSSFLNRNFLHTFRHNSYTYFVGLDEFNNSMQRIFMMRVCGQQNELFSTDGFDMYEIALSCGSVSQEASIIGMFISHNMMFVDISELNYTKQCVFNITDINFMMDSTYDVCLKENYSNPLPWASSDRYKCDTLSRVSLFFCTQ